jgi:TolB-like protein
MSFWGELKRRNVTKVAVAYAIVAWLLIQIADTLLPIFAAPSWVLPVIVLLLAMGFVLTVFVSWTYELTPGGLARTEEVPLSASVTQATGKKINVAIIGLLLLALGFVVLDQYVLEEREGEIFAAAALTNPDDEARGRLPNSVAVLPFDNLSPDPNDAYFAEGLHEEILNQLVKLSELSVISRTTMLLYADREKSPPEIADELNVETVMEGSVRYAGERIRVTIQLIDPATDLHLISEIYDADISNLDEIFNIQSDIAMQVANALQAEFSPEEQSRIEQIPTDSPQAWSEYIAGRAFNSRFTADDFLRAFDRLNRAVELDPEFGLAWAEKARAYANAVPYFPERAEEYSAIADEALARALETGDEFPEVHVHASIILAANGQWLDAEEEVSRVVDLSLDSSFADQFSWRVAVGRGSTVAESWRNAAELDPLNPASSYWVTAILDAIGDTDAALAEYERGRSIFDESWVGHFNAVVTLLGQGDHERAKELAESVIGNAVLAEVLDDFDRPDDALATLRNLYGSDAYTDLNSRQVISILAAYFGDESLSLRAMRDYLSQFGVSPYLWRPVFAAVRRHEDFKTLARDFGFVEYWQAYGWADSCEPLGANDFECR